MRILVLIFAIAFALAVTHDDKCHKKGLKDGGDCFKDACMLKAIKQKGEKPTCKKGWKLIGGYCYDKCPKGYKTVGKVCIEECKKCLIDEGDKCVEPKSYSRKPGYPCDKKEECEEHSETEKCEKFGNKYYPTCKKGWHPVGCCICVPDCPVCKGYIKKIIKRARERPTCKPKTYLVKGKCYPKCPKGLQGKGHLCWEECPEGKEQCGFFCVVPKCCKCNRDTDRVLKELGLFILFIQNDGKPMVLDKALIKKHWEEKCKDLSKEKKEACEDKIERLLELIPGKVKGKDFVIDVCKARPR